MKKPDLKTFKVLVSRTYHSSKIYKVEARTEEDALELAEENSFEPDQDHFENAELIEVRADINEGDAE